MNPIGLQIMQMMVERRLTVKEVAARMKCSNAYVSALRRGRRRFTPRALDKLLNALDADMGERWQLHFNAAVQAGWKIDLASQPSQPDTK